MSPSSSKNNAATTSSAVPTPKVQPDSVASSSKIEKTKKVNPFIKSFQSKDGVIICSYHKNVAKNAMKFRHIPYPSEHKKRKKREKGKQKENAESSLVQSSAQKSAPPVETTEINEITETTETTDTAPAADPALPPDKISPTPPVKIKGIVPGKTKRVLPVFLKCVNCLSPDCENTFSCGCASMCNKCKTIEDIDFHSFVGETSNGELYCLKCKEIINPPPADVEE